MINPSLLQQLLAGFQPESPSARPPAVQKALFLARRLQARATELQTAPEKRQQAELDRMLQTPSDKATLAQMTDQAFRTSDPHRAVEHLIHILDVQGVPRFFGPDVRPPTCRRAPTPQAESSKACPPTRRLHR